MSLTPTPSMSDLYNQLTILEELVHRHCRDHDLLLTGIQHLKQGGPGWKDKVYTLLFHANVPVAWIIDIVQIHPDQAVIQGINTLTTRIIAQRLKKYLDESPML